MVVNGAPTGIKNLVGYNPVNRRNIMRYLFKTVSWMLGLTAAALYAKPPEVALVIHGGAGTLTRDKITPELEKEIRASLEAALKAGYAKLQEGEPAVEAVKAAIVLMEDSHHFNAGKGAVFTHDGVNELDASIMNGADLNAGAVTGVTAVKNPILLADKVMTDSVHVMLSGAGAQEFAKSAGLEMVEPKYYFVERRWQQLEKAKAKEQAIKQYVDDTKFGTVGAVALDHTGNIAAGTSTGGMTNKRWGRIGDSPVIGSGTYAESQVCGVSATGHGEYFIRAAVAYDICARVKYKGQNIQQAADEVVQDKLVDMKGSGGIIALGADGQVAYSFNTEGMYRGSINTKGEMEIGIFKE
jgi:beta-aspartyl-peptidase (threonine type)